MRDGHVAVAALTQDQVHGIMRAVGRPEFVEDERFSTLTALLENLDEFARETAAAGAEMSVAESVANLEREDVPCAPVLSPDQAIEHPQVKASGTVEEVTHPVMGRMLRPRPAARFSKSPAEISRHAPSLGEHGGEVLGELGLDDAEQADLRERGITG